MRRWGETAWTLGASTGVPAPNLRALRGAEHCTHWVYPSLLAVWQRLQIHILLSLFTGFLPHQTAKQQVFMHYRIFPTGAK
jgi:hypothetical protein